MLLKTTIPHPTAVLSQVPIPQTRGGMNVDDLLPPIQQELTVIHNRVVQSSIRR